MNVLIITDNVFLQREFEKLILEKNLADVVFSYMCSPGSAEMFCQAGCGEITEIKVKEDYQEIIDAYDLVISMHCKQLFPARLAESVQCVNIHPGLNPYNRGWYPQIFAIINKLPHGATIHKIDAELDHGPIIAQKLVDIYEWDTSRTVYERVQNAELELLNEHLEAIVNRSYTTTLPASEGNLNLIKDFRSMCEIDMDKPVTMREAIDYLRALTHEPYKNAYFLTENGERVYVAVSFDKKA